jgi:hypothetical protein
MNYWIRTVFGLFWWCVFGLLALSLLLAPLVYVCGTHEPRPAPAASRRR